jgi:transcription antitermination factor NusG
MIQQPYQIGTVEPYDPPRIIAPGPPRWHALMVRPQREAATKAWLDRFGVYAFFPVTERWRIKPGHHAPIRCFARYLPGYLFAHFKGEPIWHNLFASPFVRDVIRLTATNEPGHLDPATITGLLAMREVDEKLAERRRLQRIIRQGDRARVKDGVFAGCQVEVVSVNSSRGKIKLMIFGQVREAEVDLDNLERTEPPCHDFPKEDLNGIDEVINKIAKRHSGKE